MYCWDVDIAFKSGDGYLSTEYRGIYIDVDVTYEVVAVALVYVVVCYRPFYQEVAVVAAVSTGVAFTFKS